MTQATARVLAGERIRSGALALVVGPSGAGKDTLIAAARAAIGDDLRLLFARRVVTRASHDLTEVHDSLTPAEFTAARVDGAFLLSWEAHGLAYGIPIQTAAALGRAQVVVANVSRTAIVAAECAVERVVVLHVTAPPEILAQRIAARGREPVSDIAARLARQAPLVADRAEIIEIVNDGSLEAAAQRLTAELRRLADEAAAGGR